MTQHCPFCESQSVQKRGTRVNATGVRRHRYRCNGCEKWFAVYDNKPSQPVVEQPNKFTSVIPVDFAKYDRYVISAVQNDTNVNYEFLEALKNYCNRNNAKLLLIPIRYKVKEGSTYDVDEDLLYQDDALLCKKLRLLAHVQITPTIETPLAGLDYLSKGNSLIIAHPQLQMRTVATLDDSPAILHTTGAVTYDNYVQTKQGEKARFNHSMSALVVEKEPSQFHIRVLNCDDNNGFFDIDGYYSKDAYKPLDHVEAIILGDEHVRFFDPEVKKATFTDPDSIVNRLKPKKILRGDSLDFISGSHHHNNNYFARYGKYATGLDNVEEELKVTLKFIADTTPSFAETIIIGSNHNDHFGKWLSTSDPKLDLVNSKIYHKMMYLMMEACEKSEYGFSYPNPFKLWIDNTKHDFPLPPIKFLGRNESYKICGIELALHGDISANGAKGSPVSFSKLPVKVVVGHSHSPSILKGCYTVGTSSRLKLEYTSGPSSWMHTHCVIYSNSRRQLINIINSKWKK